MTDLYRVTTLLSGALVSGGGINQLYFNVADGGADDACNAVGEFWDAIKGHLSVYVTADIQADVAVINSSNGGIESIAPGIAESITGTASGEPLPPATQGLIRFRTGQYLNGREVRGRMFIPGVPEADSVGGPTTGYTGALQIASEAMRVGDNFSQWIFSRKNFQTYPVSSTSVWGKFAVLRGRRD